MSYNHLRANIRNAYFCESDETILSAYREKMADPAQRSAAKYLRELLDESGAEPIRVESDKWFALLRDDATASAIVDDAWNATEGADWQPVAAAKLVAEALSIVHGIAPDGELVNWRDVAHGLVYLHYC